MSFLERIRATVNAGLDRAHVWYFEYECPFVGPLRRLLQTPEERRARRRRTYPPLLERSPDQAFWDRAFAAGLSVLIATVIAQWVLIAIRLLS